jgi:Domain of unknown function (DUF6048)
MAQDSLATKPATMAVTISADIGKGFESLANRQTKWEFGVGVQLRKVQFVAEYGYGQLNPESVINNGSYTSEGNYYRIGIEYVTTVSPKRYLSSGILYSQADFTDFAEVNINSDLWDDLNQTFVRPGLSASWIEWIVNTEAPLFKAESGFMSGFYWGVRFRLRMLITDLSQPDFDIFAIPGYGKTYSNVVPAANLYFKYRINF